MASSLMRADCSSLTTSHLIHWNRPNDAFLPRRCIGQLSFRTTASRHRGCTLSIPSSYSDAAMVIDDIYVGIDIMAEINTETSGMKKSIGAIPRLGVILVGDRELYEHNEILSLSIGIRSSIVRLAEDSSEEEVLKTISRFNDDPCIHGILVHSRLPSHLDEQNILNAISVEKDVQGVNELNIGRLAMRGGREPLFVPPAPKGCIELLHRYNFEIKGKKALVIIGNSNTFGMPAALLLQREDATVTIIDSRTKNPEEFTRESDIIISATGEPNMVRGKPGACIINVGTSEPFDPNVPYGGRFLRDLPYEQARKVATTITHVSTCYLSLLPKVMLLSNTLTSAKRIHNFM